MVASKPASTRVRRNKTSTRALLHPVENPEIPDLPDHTDWLPQVRSWWTNVWSSPMAPEWTMSDQDAMFLAARLMQQFWDDSTSSNARAQTSAEIRQILQQCGLTPMSRRSLQWEIAKAEDASDRTEQRRAGKAERPKSVRPDPRAGMRAV